MSVFINGKPFTELGNIDNKAENISYGKKDTTVS